MEFKDAMESVKGLDNSDEIIGAITGRISKANSDNIDYKASLAEKDTEISTLKEGSTNFLKTIGVDSFEGAVTSFNSLKKDGGESSEQSLLIAKLQTDLKNTNETLAGFKSDNEAKELKIQESKKSSIIKKALGENNMIDSDLIVGSFMNLVSFDSEGELVDSKGNKIDKIMETALDTEPHLKKSSTKGGSGGTFKGSSNSGNIRSDLVSFLDNK